MKHQLTPTIILTGGGSGGHITPLLSLGRELKKANPKCYLIYIGLKGDKLEGLQAKYEVFDEVCLITAGKFRRYHGQSFLAHLVDVRTLSLNLLDFFKVIIGTISAFKLLKRLQPDAVFSKGSYVAVPVGIAAHFKHIPIITHDSDASAGLANRIIGRWAKVHATGMPAENYDYPEGSVRYVGIPLDDRIKPVTKHAQAEFKEGLALPVNNLVLLIAGGGLGAQKINDKLIEAAPSLLENNSSLYIVHITGQRNEADVTREYSRRLSAEVSERIRILGFSDEFYKYSAAADIIITRAGATALAEFAAAHKACIVIPSPYLTGGHQLKNTDQLKQKGAAVVLSNDVPAKKLEEAVNELISSTDERAALAKNLGELSNPDAAAKLARIVLAAAGGEAGA